MPPRQRPGKEVAGSSRSQPSKKRAGDDSSPRHPHKRRDLASARREGPHARSCAIHYATSEEGHSTGGVAGSNVVGSEYEEYELKAMLMSRTPHFDKEDFLNYPGFAEEEGDREEEVQQVCNVHKGKGGRFVRPQGSSSSSRRQPRRKVDDSWLVKGPMPGGPQDGSVIPSYAAHIARSIWDGDDRGVLDCRTRHQACSRLIDWADDFREPAPFAQRVHRDRFRQHVEIGRIVAASGLLELPRLSYTHVDAPLVSAFVERWQPDTNSFHMPFGEMSILLHDVECIMGLPVDGRRVDGVSPRVSSSGQCDPPILDVAEMLGVSHGAMVRNGQYKNGGVSTECIFNQCQTVEGRAASTRAIGWMLLTLGSTIFVDKSGSRLSPSLITELMDEMSVGKYSWGSATLAHLYHQLGQASRRRCKQMAGCLTLLQAWIYEYFPTFRPNRGRLQHHIGDPSCSQWDVRLEPNTPDRLVGIRNRIDNMTVDQVCWLPFGDNPGNRCLRTLFTGFIQHQSTIEPYIPYRCLRQLGYLQGIPPRIPTPISVSRPEDPRHYHVQWSRTSAQDTWDTFPISHSLNLSTLCYCQFVGATTENYEAWFNTYSHPFVVNDRDLILNEGPDATVPEHWIALLSEKSKKVLWDPLIDELPQHFDRLRLGIEKLRSEFMDYETRVGIRRHMPQEHPPGWGGHS